MGGARGNGFLERVAVMRGVWLEDLTWPEAAERFEASAVVLVPIGAASKEHGHHLPLCTDFPPGRAGITEGVLEELAGGSPPPGDLLRLLSGIPPLSGAAASLPATLGRRVARGGWRGSWRQGVPVAPPVLNTGVSTEGPW